MWTTVVVFVAMVIITVENMPVQEPAPVLSSYILESDIAAAHIDPLENIGVELEGAVLVEGDIRMARINPEPQQMMKAQGDYSSGAKPHQVRNSVSTEERTWPDRVVPYLLDETLNMTEVQLINEAMSTIIEDTDSCVRFVPRSAEQNFVFITQQLTGCYSEVGMKGGNQTMSVSRASGCFTIGIIMHELMHALGFWHEHTRPDRDTYINILSHNIRFDHLSDFGIRQDGKILVPEYDYYSVMHYKTTAFSKDSSNLKTFEILQNGINETMVGQREFLSEYDKRRIRLLYGCDKSRRTLNTPTPQSDTPGYAPAQGMHGQYPGPETVVYSSANEEAQTALNETQNPASVSVSVSSASSREISDVLATQTRPSSSPSQSGFPAEQTDGILMLF